MNADSLIKSYLNQGEGVTECVGVSSIKDISHVVRDASAIDLPPPKQLQDPTYNEEFIMGRGKTF